MIHYTCSCSSKKAHDAERRSIGYRDPAFARIVARHTRRHVVSEVTA